MFTDVHCPESISPEELDDYLRSGWFRMGQTIFTTNFLSIRNEFHSVLWLRIDLNEYQKDRTWEKLAKKNVAFRTEIKKAEITQEKEELYQLYRQGITFDVSATLQELLLRSSESTSVFDTHEVSIYDGDKLIAIGFFDMGSSSAAGITSFYDHAYKKYSLGKYLIYLKIEYCKKLGLQYFYPGYFAPDTDLFRYKLEVASASLYYLEFNSQQWLPVARFSSSHNMLQVMKEQLRAVQSLLSMESVATELLYYEFLSANSLPQLMGMDLLDFPVFLYCSNLTEEDVQPLVIYEIQNQSFHLLLCESAWESEFISDNKEAYTTHLLKTDQHLFSSHTAEEMASVIMAMNKSVT